MYLMAFVSSAQWLFQLPYKGIGYGLRYCVDIMVSLQQYKFCTSGGRQNFSSSWMNTNLITDAAGSEFCPRQALPARHISICYHYGKRVLGPAMNFSYIPTRRSEISFARERPSIWDISLCISSQQQPRIIEDIASNKNFRE